MKFFNEQVNMEKRKNLTNQIKKIEIQISKWYENTGTQNFQELENYIENTQNSNLVRYF